MDKETCLVILTREYVVMTAYQALEMQPISWELIDSLYRTCGRAVEIH